MKIKSEYETNGRGASHSNGIRGTEERISPDPLSEAMRELVRSRAAGDMAVIEAARNKVRSLLPENAWDQPAAWELDEAGIAEITKAFQTGSPEQQKHARAQIEILLGKEGIRVPQVVSHWNFAVPDREWLIPDWLPAGRIGLLTGEGEKGKSLLALQLAARMAAGGGLWLGRGVNEVMPAVSDGIVVIAHWEDEKEEVRRRISWIEGADRSDGADRSMVACMKDSLRYVDLARFGPVWGRIGEGRHAQTGLTTTGQWLREQCKQAKLLILDPLINAYGADENANEDAAQFMADWGGWAREEDCTVLLCHHPSKTDAEDHGFRGASAWSAEARFHWQLTDQQVGEDGEKRKVDLLRCRKASYALRPAPVYLQKDKTTGWIWRVAGDQNPEGKHQTDSANGTGRRPRRKATDE